MVSIYGQLEVANSMNCDETYLQIAYELFL